MATYNIEWTIERGEVDSFEVYVDYTYRRGSPAHYGSLTYPGHPADPPEVEVGRVWLKSDAYNPNVPKFTLTDAELRAVEMWLLENPPERDYPEDR